MFGAWQKHTEVAVSGDELVGVWQFVSRDRSSMIPGNFIKPILQSYSSVIGLGNVTVATPRYLG